MICQKKGIILQNLKTIIFTYSQSSDSSKHSKSDEVPCKMPREPSINFLLAGN